YSQGRGGLRGIYRLTIDPVKGEGLGDFRLTTPLQRLSLPAGGHAVVPVFVDRRGFTGKIDLVADGLPASAKLEGATSSPDVASPVRLTLLTSQSPPVVNNQPDPNRAIRLEKPTEFGAKVSEGDVPVVIPVELPADSYQIAVLAELLTPDKQRVLASAVTPVRALP